jgi:hypothetical protein
MILAALLAILAVIGLLLAILDFGAKMNSPAPSMYRSGVGEFGMVMFFVCGALALACWASFS